MKLRSRSTLQCAFGLAAAATWLACYWYYSRNISRLSFSLDNVIRCEQLANDIERIRQAPQRARLTIRNADDLGSLIEKAASNAGIARDRVLRIDPQPPKRVSKSNYLYQSTELELLPVSLRQLIDLLNQLNNNDGELAVGTIRLRVPHETEQAADKEFWLTDVVLTQRVYAPTSARQE